MGHYRIYQLDPANHIRSGFSIECASDAAALRVARAVLEESAGVEVWKSNNRVARLEGQRLWEERRKDWMESG